MKDPIAESYIGEKVTDVVITVPAYFNDSQKTLKIWYDFWVKCIMYY